MHKRMMLVLLAAAITVACSAVSFAQTPPSPSPIPPPPEQGVRGSGVIPLPQGVGGAFDINVWRAGPALYGGFRYMEIGTSTRRTLDISTRAITELTVRGNFAVVRAVGTWNGMPANLMIEVLDDNPSGDWFHIVAVPQGPLTIIYDRSGGVVKGDVQVFGAPVDLHTKGDGLIALSNASVGRFGFTADRVKGIIGGSLMYSELSPVLSSIPIRGGTRISLPKVDRLEIFGNTAVFSGMGTCNARPARIEVRVTDNSMLDAPIPVPDEFAIRAVSAVVTSIAPVVLYDARGPLRAGDIIVATGR